MAYLTRRFLRGAMVVFSWFVIPYSKLANIRTPNRKLPPIKNTLLKISAIKLSHMIRTRQVTCESVIQAYIDRCNEVNCLLNAIVADRFEAALAEAKAIDADIVSGRRTPGQMEKETPLLGLPITVKESLAVTGMPHQAGQIFKESNIATFDAPCVAQVRKYGGIILLVSNTPELCMCWETYNKVSGTTRNPYDLKRTPGGSSGGEAALLGSAASLIGLSSDVAGSARLPAMFCGIYGHKPSPYLVSSKGHIPSSDAPDWGDYFTVAPMTRYASDLPLLLKCIVDPNGPTIPSEMNIKPCDIKYYYMPNDGPSGTTRPISKDINIAIHDVASHFRATKVNIKQLKWALDISMSSMLRIENVETIYYQERRPTTSIGKESLKYMLGLSNSTFPSVMFGHLQEVMQMFPDSRHKKLADIASTLKQQFLTMLGTNGVFLYPTFPTTAHEHYRIYHKLVDTGYMMVFNAIGLPVTNCMIRLDKNSLPIGIQVVANPGQDHLTLAVAKAIEEEFGGWQPPPSD